MTKLIFVDTSALIALGNKGDSFHKQAVEIHEDLKTKTVKFVTTNAIILEFGNAFSFFGQKPHTVNTTNRTTRITSRWADGVTVCGG